jgi:hypothetical protein
VTGKGGWIVKDLETSGHSFSSYYKGIFYRGPRKTKDSSVMVTYILTETRNEPRPTRSSTCLEHYNYACSFGRNLILGSLMTKFEQQVYSVG